MQRPMPIIIPEYVERTFQLPGRTHYGREQPIYLFHDWPTPASRKAMKGLPMPAVGKTRELGCMVCLEDFEVGDKLRMMPCSHSFHQRCIFRWLRISRQCPCCRFPLPSSRGRGALMLDDQAEAAHADNEGFISSAEAETMFNS